MKGDITIQVLEALGDTAIALADLFDVFLSVGYGASLGKFEAELRKRERYETPERKLSQRYYSLLHQLEKQGFIERKKRTNGIFIRMTAVGKGKLNALKKRRKEMFPKRYYETEENNRRFTIIAFDVPEKSKRKRNWLRSALDHLGMSMIQKSVWAGKIKLPKEFLKDLREYEIIEYVEIFEVTKSGSLRQVD